MTSVCVAIEGVCERLLQALACRPDPLASRPEATAPLGSPWGHGVSRRVPLQPLKLLGPCHLWLVRSMFMSVPARLCLSHLYLYFNSGATISPHLPHRLCMPVLCSVGCLILADTCVHPT